MQQQSRGTIDVPEWMISFIRSIENRLGRLDQGQEDLTDMAIRRLEKIDTHIGALQAEVATMKAQHQPKLADRLPLSVREILAWAVVGIMSFAGTLSADTLADKLAGTLIGRLFHQ
jgi:uncharacterized small protein (DUF1192 family)